MERNDGQYLEGVGIIKEDTAFIYTKSTAKGVSPTTGADQIKVYLTPAQAEELYKQIGKLTNQRGLRLTLSSKNKEHQGRNFLSTNVQVAGVQEQGASFNSNAGSSKSFVPKQPAAKTPTGFGAAGVLNKTIG